MGRLGWWRAADGRRSETHGREHWIRVTFWVGAVTLGFTQVWANRSAMNPDGVSYLDIGDAYARGDWSAAINAHFSPLYSWILGATLAAIRPRAAWEFPVVHLANVG